MLVWILEIVIEFWIEEKEGLNYSVFFVEMIGILKI